MSDFSNGSYENEVSDPTRERYRRQKEQYREGRRKIEEIEKREKNLFRMFSALFYGDIDEKHVRKIEDAFSNYTPAELEELYTKMQYIAPWKEEGQKSVFKGTTVREALSFLTVYAVTDIIAMIFLSFFVWRLMGNFVYILYSAAVSAGLLSIVLAVKGVIKLVRKKEREE